MRLLLTLILSLTAEISPAATPSAPNSQRLGTLLTVNCLQCHAQAHTGAPVMGDVKAWEPVLAQGRDTIMKHVVEGKAGMPPLGYCYACDESDLLALTELVIGQPLPRAAK